MSTSGKDRRRSRARAKQASKFDRRTTRNRTIILIMAVLMALSLVAIPLGAWIAGDGAAAPGSDPATDEEVAEPETAEGPCGPAADDVPEITSEIYDEPFELTIDPDEQYVATLETTCGEIVFDLAASDAPIAVNNLASLADEGYYDGVIFHRVVPGFVVQVGDPAGTGCGQDDCANFDPDAPTYPGYDFEDELQGAEELYDATRERTVEQLRDAVADEADGDAVEDELLEQVPGGYPRGTVAMANAGPDTNGSQFFITQGEPTTLPGPDYTVLGTVAVGMDVVDAIAASPTDAAGVPLEPVAIRRLTVVQR